MKKIMLSLSILLLISGCEAEETSDEKVNDIEKMTNEEVTMDEMDPDVDYLKYSGEEIIEGYRSLYSDLGEVVIEETEKMTFDLFNKNAEGILQDVKVIEETIKKTKEDEMIIYINGDLGDFHREMIRELEQNASKIKDEANSILAANDKKDFSELEDSISVFTKSYKDRTVELLEMLGIE